MAEPIVIIGAGLAAATAAATLREQGAPGAIVLLGDEEHLPYLRPPLSKEYLTDEAPLESVFIHDDAWYDEHDIEVRRDTRVTGIDPGLHLIDLADETRVHYSRALIATGSRARDLPVRGAELDGVLTLRRLADCQRIKHLLRGAERIVVVGAGWIGLEVASAARRAGVDVTIIEPEAQPLLHVLGAQVGSLFADLHIEYGVRLLTGTRVTEFVGEAGTVAGVRLGDHAVLPADAVVVGVGAIPNVEPFAASGLAIANGIVADAGLATNAPDVFVAGDVANAFHPRLDRRIRVEHWDNARGQGAAAALAMLDRRITYDRTPYFYSDQFDVGLEYTGFAPFGSYDRVVLRGDPAEHRYVAFWLAGGRVLAGMNVNTWDVRPQIEDLVTGGRIVDPVRLADEAVPLTDVALPGSGFEDELASEVWEDESPAASPRVGRMAG